MHDTGTHPFQHERRTLGGFWIHLQSVPHEKEDNKSFEFLGCEMPRKWLQSTKLPGTRKSTASGPSLAHRDPSSPDHGMIGNDLPVLGRPFLRHIPPRIVLRCVLVNLFVQVDRPRHANNLVIRVEPITAKLYWFCDTSDGHDGGRVPERLLDSRCQKGEVNCRDEFKEMVLEFLSGVLLLPCCDGLVDLVNQRLEAVLSLKVQDDQPIPSIRGVCHQSEEEGEKVRPDGLRTLESSSVNTPKVSRRCRTKTYVTVTA